ncbi:energy transducer TonB [Marinifilum fragile]
MEYTLILIVALFFTQTLYSQSDTIVYYKGHAPCDTIHGADRQVVFQRKNDKKSVMMTFELKNNQWKLEKTEIIKRMRNGRYAIGGGTNNIIRSYKKINGGYQVEEYNYEGKLRKKGLSKKMFPLHRVGQWQSLYDNNVVGIEVFNEELMVQSYTIFKGRNLPNNIYANADTIAEYKGGDDGFAKDLAHNIEYPRICQENGISGCVLVLFAVDESGMLADIQILKKVDPYLDEAAIEAIKACNKWRPAIKDGKPVKLYNIAPVNFLLR